MTFFSFKTYLYRIFWPEFEIRASELTHVPNFSSIGQKIRELEFWSGTTSKMAWWRHTYLLVTTSAKFLRLLRDFVPEYHHAMFGCNWTTNKGEAAYMVPKDPSMNRIKFCVFTIIIRGIIGSKFQIDRITVILFSGSGLKSPPPPPPPVAGEISKCRRL